MVEDGTIWRDCVKLKPTKNSYVILKTKTYFDKYYFVCLFFSPGDNKRHYYVVQMIHSHHLQNTFTRNDETCILLFLNQNNIHI